MTIVCWVAIRPGLPPPAKQDESDNSQNEEDNDHNDSAGRCTHTLGLGFRRAKLKAAGSVRLERGLTLALSGLTAKIGPRDAHGDGFVVIVVVIDAPTG